jgi:hypothetical protein
MRKTRLFFLIQEYRLAQERVNYFQSKAVKVKTAEQIDEVLNKDLVEELKRAKKIKDKEAADLYAMALDKYFPQDSDRPNDQDKQEAEKLLSKEVRGLVTYYEAKIRTIKKLLGIRNAELLDNYDEKSLFMGDGSSGGRLLEEIEKEEEQAKKKDPGDFTFGKM